LACYSAVVVDPTIEARMAINADEQNRSEASGLTGGLFHSLNGFVSTLVNVAQTRLQLLTTELQEEVQRAAQMLIWAFVSLFAALMALFLGSLTVIFVFWDTHRLVAAVAMTGVMLAVAAGAGLVLRAKLATKPPMLDATLAELAKDRAQLRSSE
jgi:uncharacterized membrane protein YqjE